MPRQLHFGLHPYGVGGPGQDGLWKDPRVAKNASIDINYYVQQAKLAETGLFDAFFVVDSQFINASYPAHYLNRLEPLTLLSAVATHTTNIGLVVTAITSALLGSVAPAQSGIASGAFTASRQTGSVLGVAVFGALLASLQPFTGLEVTFAIGTGLVAVVAALGHAAA